MSGHEQYPDKLFVPLDFEVEPPFGVLEFMTEETIYESPFFIARYGNGQEMTLHWFNTCVRLFRNNTWATHLDVQLEDRKVGVTVDEDFADLLLEYHYPSHESPFIDPASIAWLGERALDGLDDELRDL